MATGAREDLGVIAMTRETQPQGTRAPVSLSTGVTYEDTSNSKDHMFPKGEACTGGPGLGGQKTYLL